jgi:hypothetical protein
LITKNTKIKTLNINDLLKVNIVKMMFNDYKKEQFIKSPNVSSFQNFKLDINDNELFVNMIKDGSFEKQTRLGGTYYHKLLNVIYDTTDENIDKNIKEYLNNAVTIFHNTFEKAIEWQKSQNTSK